MHVASIRIDSLSLPQNGDELWQRLRETGSAIPTTASQISRSKDFHRTAALPENLVQAIGGSQKLVSHWQAECLELVSQRRSSTRLARMYEMLLVPMFHV